MTRVYAPLLLTCALLVAACAKQAVHGDASRDSLPPSMRSQADDRHVLAGEWKYAEGVVVRLTLDEQGNGRYPWKDGRFETHALIGHTWHGACDFRRRMVERVDLRSISRLIFQKGRDAGGSAASGTTI